MGQNSMGQNSCKMSFFERFSSSIVNIFDPMANNGFESLCTVCGSNYVSHLEHAFVRQGITPSVHPNRAKIANLIYKYVPTNLL